MVDVTGSDNIGGTNQTADNTFTDGAFFFEWIELAFAPNNLPGAGFNMTDGSLGPTQTVYNAGTSDILNLPNSSGTLGPNDDTFAVRITTTLEVTTGGTYTFTLDSDDGSALYVDGNQVVIDDALQPTGSVESGTVVLGPGLHEITIIYFEQFGGVGLISTINGPDYAGPTALQDANIQSNAGDDTISAGEGDDVIDGGAGDDIIQGGAGNDIIEGGIGFDTISGGDGADIITDDNGGGDFDGGAGDDTISITGADFPVTVTGGSGNDDVTVFNSPGLTNTIDLGEGDDIFRGGDTVDIVTGGTGNDTIISGGGDDVLDGGDGDDSFILFTGDDTATGGLGNDNFFEGAGEGADVITDFNVGNTGALDDGDQTNNDFVDLSGFYNTTTLTSVNGVGGNFGNALAMLRADAEDGRLDGIIGGVDYSAQIVGVDLTLQDGAGGSVTGADLTFDNTNVVCFAKGTQIQTITGDCLIEDLQVGDRVLTMDNGYQEIKWIGGTRVSRETLSENPKLKPIRIRAGALGSDLPKTDLVVSPQHRILVRSVIAIRMFDTNEVLIPANKLLAIDGIDIVDDGQDAEYFHMLFDRHEIVFSNGAPTESLFTGPEALKSVSADAQREIATLFAGILEPDFVPVSARLIPAKGKHMKHLAERHQRNKKDLVSLN